MFFFIGEKSPLSGLEQYDTSLFLDKGWKHKKSIYYKGYSTECVLEDSLSKILDGFKPAGKWCVIHNGKIFHPKFRGFPLYQKDSSFTNIKLDGYNTVLYDYPFDYLANDVITIDDAADIIGHILYDNVKNFYQYNDITEMNVLYSGGLDTLTSWAVFDSYKKDYTLNVYVPKDSDDTVHKYNGRIREYNNELLEKISKDYWGYGVSSVYTNENWYLTGFYAEVMQFRDGEAINAIANYYGKYIDELASDQDYLYWFLKRPSLGHYKKEMLSFANEHEIKTYLLGTVLYDNQMWHLDNNLTFNPFADLRIPKAIYRLSIKDISINSVTGIVQKKIVNNFNPKLLPLLSDFKNEKDVWANFKKHWDVSIIDKQVKLCLR